MTNVGHRVGQPRLVVRREDFGLNQASIHRSLIMVLLLLLYDFKQMSNPRIT